MSTTWTPERSAEIRGSVDRRQQLADGAAAVRDGTDRTSQRVAERDPDLAEPALPAQYRGEVAVPGRAVVQAREQIDGDQVLRYIYTFLKRFAVWGSEAEIVACALWIAQTYARDGDGFPVWQYCTRLAILGPSGSGKSWKARLVGKLSHSPEILVTPSKAAFTDLCAENSTVIITEADEQFGSPGKSRDILAVINASYEPDRTAPRKQGGKVARVRVFTHVVLDGIDDVLKSKNRPDLRAMMSRCIEVPARIAPEGYRPPRFDAQARAIAAQLAQRAAAWMTQEVADGMADDVPVVPGHLGNRPFALWEPLFTVALRADQGDPDGPWSRACAQACEVLEAGQGLTQPTEDEESELDRQMAAWGGE